MPWNPPCLKKIPGRPKKTSNRAETLLKKAIEKSPSKTARKLKEVNPGVFGEVSVRTVNRRLSNLGYKRHISSLSSHSRQYSLLFLSLNGQHFLVQLFCQSKSVSRSCYQPLRGRGDGKMWRNTAQTLRGEETQQNKCFHFQGHPGTGKINNGNFRIPEWFN